MINVRVKITESTPSPGSFFRNALKKADDLTPLMTRFGRYMVPGAITEHWPKTPPVMRFGAGATPLQDTGRLRDSIQAIPSARDLLLQTNVPYARIHQGQANGEPTIVTPVRAKWLAIPQYPALSISEIHSRRSPRAYQGLFVLMHGPEGAGLYRKKGRKSVQMVFRFLKKVTIPARRFLFFSAKDITVLRRMTKEFFA